MTTLTIVIVCLEGANNLRRCLRAISSQQNIDDYEIIVPHDDTLLDVDSLRSDFADVSFLALSNKQTYAALRSHGVRTAKGNIVAITEDHCIPRHDWAAEILRAHASEHAAVGGAVEKKAPDSRLNWALYLIDYLRYSAPNEGPSRNLTDCNASYKRSALEVISEVWIEEFHEPEVNGSLQVAGMSLWISPKIIVDQQRTISFTDAIRDRYRFGRLFGARRALRAPFSRRLFYLSSALLLPALLTARTLRDAHSKPDYTAAFWRSFLTIVFLNFVWTWGEFIGSLTNRSDKSLGHAQ